MRNIGEMSRTSASQVGEAGRLKTTSKCIKGLNFLNLQLSEGTFSSKGAFRAAHHTHVPVTNRIVCPALNLRVSRFEVKLGCISVTSDCKLLFLAA